jgi:hypothetical protein
MRCKTGDLAMITGDKLFPENNGRLVNIKGPATAEAYEDPLPGEWDCEPLQPVYGMLDGAVFLDMEDTAFEDHELTPIRYREGDDETLSWAKRPDHVTG